MNNFCLCSILVRAALASHRLEPSCETHTGAAVLKIIKTSDSGGADLPFVRHLRPHQMHNSMAISHLSLCSQNDRILGLVRHPANSGMRLSRLPTTHTLQPAEQREPRSPASPSDRHRPAPLLQPTTHESRTTTFDLPDDERPTLITIEELCVN